MRDCAGLTRFMNATELLEFAVATGGRLKRHGAAALHNLAEVVA